jgi:non-ribosomal peptide synthetase component F
LSPDLTKALRALSRREGVTLFTTILAAYGAALRALTGAHDIVIGTDFAGRGDRALDDLIGLFVNQAAIRLRMRDDQPFTTFLQHVAEKVREAHAHLAVPFSRVLEAVAPSTARGRAPLFNVKIAMQPGHRFESLADDLIITPLPVTAGQPKFDLLLNVTDAEPLTFTLEYAAAGAPHSEWLLNQLISVLEAAAADSTHELQQLIDVEGIRSDPVPTLHQSLRQFLDSRHRED